MRDYDVFVEQLDLRGENPVREDAIRRLREAGEVAKPALFLGLGHPAWRVRHGCLRVLDHTIVDDETRRRVVTALGDPHRKVRIAAMHLLGCEACKPDGFCDLEGVDIDGIYLHMIETDPSLRVRRSAVARFMWGTQPLEGRVRSVMSAVLNTSPDQDLRRRSRFVLAWEEAFLDGPSVNAGIARFRELLSTTQP
jgi:hypothetical protein